MREKTPQLNIAWKPVPRPPALVAGILFTCLMVALCLPQLYTSNVRLKKPTLQVAQLLPREKPSKNDSAIEFRAKANAGGGVRVRPSKSKVVAKNLAPVGDGEPSLGVRARRTTTELMQDFKFSMNFGFHAGPKLQFPSKISGEIPQISAEEAFYEQYVIVEATIDVDGSVAEARVTTGRIPPKLQEKLIAAVKGFRYAPATRDGIAVPALMDIVIHVPS